MDVKKEFALDSKRVKDGVWFNAETGTAVYEKLEELKRKGICCLLVRPLGQMNKEYKDRLSELIRPLRRQRRRGNASIDETLEEKVTEAASQEVVLNWFNLEEGGVPVEYSPEEAYRLMTTYPELREEWLGYANDLHAFRLEEVAEGTGN